MGLGKGVEVGGVGGRFWKGRSYNSDVRGISLLSPELKKTLRMGIGVGLGFGLGSFRFGRNNECDSCSCNRYFAFRLS